MIRLAKALYESALNKVQSQTAGFKAQTKLFKEASNIVVDRPDKDGWIRQFQASDREKGLLQANQLDMLRKAREFARFDPNAKAALSTLVNYIMGRGLGIAPKSDDPMVWYVWNEFSTSPRNKWAAKQFELINRGFRDGEVFVQFFNKDADKKNTGKTTIRFIDPLMVRSAGNKGEDPSKTINNGVNTDPDDVEKVISYTVWDPADQSKFNTVDAKDVYHIKLNVDSDQKRGETALLSIMGLIRHYEQWLENRIILNKIRSAVVMIKHVEGTPTEVAAMSKTLPTNTNPSNVSKRANFRGGTVITEGPGVTYRMEGPNLQASDAKEDGRTIKLSMAAALNMPEYVLGDASNNNYASAMISESPFVKSIQFWQIFWEYHIAQIYRRVLQNAVDAGLLEAPNDDEFVNKLKQVRKLSESAPPAPSGGNKQDAAAGDQSQGAASNGGSMNPKPNDALANPPQPELSPKEKAMAELMPEGKLEMPSEVFFGCDMDWPEIVHRELKDHVSALTMARQNGWIADSTASSALGYDYAEEVRKQKTVEEEAQKSPNPLLGQGAPNPFDDANGMDAEMQDTLNQLSPADRNAILNSRDPKEVARIMARANKSTADAGGDPGEGD